ncbi:co-chaperone protein DjlA [Psychromonas marina]|uniref:Co-chaperone protein DjlA n=1 Tax=Psychromonas marina TaxID=88364 RepID=A0ABQ6DVT7_9GAMM|nr:co-chaperone DjlA [Psychromonas marina]GLS89157.1 co-chaperone protein DjlA [Psychromonas marina]
MRIWGKILCAFFGYMLGGPIGLLFGLWLGHRFDRASARNFNIQNGLFGNSATSQEKQKLFFEATFSVMGHVAKAKGQVTQTDIQVANAYMDQMRLQGEARSQAQSAFAEGKNADFPLEQTLAEFAQMVRGDRNVLQMFLGIQVQVAFSDGSIDQKEKAILYTIAEQLGFSRIELDRLLQMIEGQQHYHQGQQQQQQQASADDAYKILGIDETATDKEVKRAYRKLMSQNHPDKLASKGLPEEMMNLAKEKAQDIQQAYETLRKKRGFK